MWNKAKCILLETKENSGLLLGLSKFGKLISYDTKYVNLDNDAYNVKQHLYIINDDVIKVNDWYLATDKIEQCFSKEEANDLTSSCKKIIAATDKSLLLDYVGYEHGTARKYESKVYLPQIPQLFIEQYITEYNQGKIISDVLVEYEEVKSYSGNEGLIIKEWLKINQDNTINIKTVKDSFNREEVVELLESLKQDIPSDYSFNLKEWIEQNL